MAKKKKPVNQLSVLEETVRRLGERRRRRAPFSLYGPGLHVHTLSGVSTLHKGRWTEINTARSLSGKSHMIGPGTKRTVKKRPALSKSSGFRDDPLTKRLRKAVGRVNRLCESLGPIVWDPTKGDRVIEPGRRKKVPASVRKLEKRVFRLGKALGLKGRTLEAQLQDLRSNPAIDKLYQRESRTLDRRLKKKPKKSRATAD